MSHSHQLPKIVGREQPKGEVIITPVTLDQRQMFIEHRAYCNPIAKINISVKCIINSRGQLVMVPVCSDCGICLFLDPEQSHGTLVDPETNKPLGRV